MLIRTVRRGFERERRKSRGYKELAGLRRFGETVEMCGKVRIAGRPAQLPMSVTRSLQRALNPDSYDERLTYNVLRCMLNV
jgi:hypothetical protein